MKKKGAKIYQLLRSALVIGSFLVLPCFSNGCSSNIKAVPITTSEEFFGQPEPLSPPPPYIINAGDQMNITIYRRSDLSPIINLNVLVAPDGRIAFPLVGELQVEGLTVTDLRGRLAAYLSEYIVSPIVSVSLIQVTPSKVYILGEVTQPGVYTITRTTTSVEAIAMSGGFTPDAKRSLVLLFRGGGKPGNKSNSTSTQLTSLNIKNLLERADVRQNVLLQNNDILYVPSNTIAKSNRMFQTIGNALNPFSATLGLIGTAIIVGGGGK
jgi:polysaccharide export outer membrane protein